MERFATLAGPVEAEIKERGSRFLALAVPVAGRDQADAFHAEQGRAYREATHVVPAFALHDGTAWASDAGEPGGSAGPPLLQALAGAGVLDVAVVVVRWYGGTNLGIGGLVRAYGGVLALALADAPRRVVVRTTRVRLLYPHERTSAVLRAVAAHGGTQVEHGFEGADATCTVTLVATALDSFAAQLADATQGSVRPEVVG
jgi:putative IMPACT (imprinted ancient) family translation regulator